MLGIGLGILCAVVAAAAIPGSAGLIVAAVVGALGVSFGALAMKAGQKLGAAGRAKIAAADERRILQLAEANGGQLTATDLARALGMTTKQADDALTALADGTRVTVEVDDHGVVRYVFRELSLATRDRPRLRVEGEESAAAEVEAASSGTRARAEE
jgi:hypothetical protein